VVSQKFWFKKRWQKTKMFGNRSILVTKNWLCRNTPRSEAFIIQAEYIISSCLFITMEMQRVTNTLTFTGCPTITAVI